MRSKSFVFNFFLDSNGALQQCDDDVCLYVCYWLANRFDWIASMTTNKNIQVIFFVVDSSDQSKCDLFYFRWRYGSQSPHKIRKSILYFVVIVVFGFYSRSSRNSHSVHIRSACATQIASTPIRLSRTTADIVKLYNFMFISCEPSLRQWMAWKRHSGLVSSRMG